MIGSASFGSRSINAVTSAALCSIAIDEMYRRLPAQSVSPHQFADLPILKILPTARRRTVQSKVPSSTSTSFADSTHYHIGDSLRHAAIGCELAAGNGQQTARRFDQAKLTRNGRGIARPRSKQRPQTDEAAENLFPSKSWREIAIVSFQQIGNIGIGDVQGIGAFVGEGVGGADQCLASQGMTKKTRPSRGMQQQKRGRQAASRRDQVNALGRLQIGAGRVAGQPAAPHRSHGPVALSDLPGADDELPAADPVHRPHAADDAARTIQTPSPRRNWRRTAPCSAAVMQHFDAQPGVVHLGIVVGGAAGGPLAKPGELSSASCAS